MIPEATVLFLRISKHIHHSTLNANPSFPNPTALKPFRVFRGSLHHTFRAFRVFRGYENTTLKQDNAPRPWDMQPNIPLLFFTTSFLS